MVIVTVAPTARLPTVQVTVPDACVQVPWVDDADTKVTPAGRVSVTPTPVAGLGPLSVATTVYVMVLLIWAVAGPILVMDMSAVPVPWIWVTADAWLLAVFGSNSLPATAAVLVIEPGEAGAVTLMVIVTVAPTARLPTGQVPVPAAVVQRRLADADGTPAGAAGVTGGGRVSFRATAVAGVGPLFLATIVYASGLLVLAVAGAVLVIDRSAERALTVVVADAELFAVFGSGSLPLTVAVLVMV